jgi:hypothetical protein
MPPGGPAGWAATLLQGIITAMRWLDGAHEALEADPDTPG